MLPNHYYVKSEPERKFGDVGYYWICSITTPLNTCFWVLASDKNSLMVKAEDMCNQYTAENREAVELILELGEPIEQRALAYIIKRLEQIKSEPKS